MGSLGRASEERGRSRRRQRAPNQPERLHASGTERPSAIDASGLPAPRAVGTMPNQAERRRGPAPRRLLRPARGRSALCGSAACWPGKVLKTAGQRLVPRLQSSLHCGRRCGQATLRAAEALASIAVAHSSRFEVPITFAVTDCDLTTHYRELQYLHL